MSFLWRSARQPCTNSLPITQRSIKLLGPKDNDMDVEHQSVQLVRNWPQNQRTQDLSPYDKSRIRKGSTQHKPSLAPIASKQYASTKPTRSEEKPSQYINSGKRAGIDVYLLKNSFAPQASKVLAPNAQTRKRVVTYRMTTERQPGESPERLSKEKKLSAQRINLKQPRLSRNSPGPRRDLIETERQPYAGSITEESKPTVSNSSKSLQKKLSPFQREEVNGVEIYYMGPRRISCKNDFTDSEGDAKIILGDSIAYRYEIASSLGKGSFGKVFKAYDHKKKEYIALKIIKSQQKFIAQAKVEVQILETALLHDPKLRCNLVRMKGSFEFRGHSCITFQILSKNLYEYLKQTNFNGFSYDLIRRFAIQILQTLLFFSQFKIIHCDLKPENILLKEQNKSGIKVIDVGSGCVETKQIYTYIQSRFYRAPEIILGIRYTPSIDMWSFGCILIQLLTGYPLFPGETQHEQIVLFIQLLGSPPLAMLEAAERRKKFFDEQGNLKPLPNDGKLRQRFSKNTSLKELIGDSEGDFTDLVQKTLEWDPTKRITPKDALLHPWIVNGLPSTIRNQLVDQLRNH